MARGQEGDDEKLPDLRVGGMELDGDPPNKPERRPPKLPPGGIELSGASLRQSGLEPPPEGGGVSGPLVSGPLVRLPNWRVTLGPNDPVDDPPVTPGSCPV